MDKNVLVRLFEDAHINYYEAGSNLHARAGWINIDCPFCINGDSNGHLGINLDNAYGSCYKCGFHSLNSILYTITGCKGTELRQLKKDLHISYTKTDKQIIQGTAKRFILPGELITDKTTFAYQYLLERFKQYTDAIINNYQLHYTKFDYLFDTEKDGKPYQSSKYASKIVIPNVHETQIVSFQTRSYLPDEKHFITAKPDEELIHHKNFLWGDDYVMGDTVIICEAAFDAMTVGYGAVHSHGVNTTAQQVEELSTFKQVYIAFDMDKAGRDSAKKLANILNHKTKVSIIGFGNQGEKDINDLLKTKEGEKELKEIQNLLT